MCGSNGNDGSQDGRKVLDMGCGTGRQAMKIAMIISRSGLLYGVDPSSYRINIANKKLEGTPH